MKNLCVTVAFSLALACIAFQTGNAASNIPLATSAVANSEKPPQPSDVPDLRTTNPSIVCVGCDRPFDGPTHQELLNDLVKNPYLLEMRTAQYFQDIVHQFESKAHFDNCDFDHAVIYLTDLMDDVRKHTEDALASSKRGDTEGKEVAVKAAFFSIGQLLHGVQDFYAHTNYIELTANKVTHIDSIELIKPWTQSGRDRIAKLRTEGLISGYVSWGFPQVCPSGSISHASLAKDSQNMKSGMIAIPSLQNLSQYKVAVFLARETSLKLLEDIYKQWPILKDICGKYAMFDVLIDRRSANAPSGI